MIHRPVIKCGCGQRVLRRNVIQTGLYVSVLGPSYVYVRFKCGRCKRVGEHMIKEGDWDPSILQLHGKRRGEVDARRFEQMGSITPEEVIDFHYALERLSADPEEGNRHP